MAIGEYREQGWRAQHDVSGIMHELFTRRVEVAEDEQVVYVESSLENLLGFDRPVNWAEHATIGAPFLAPGKTVVDSATGRCQTRPYENQPIRRLASGKEFKYPFTLLAGRYHQD